MTFEAKPSRSVADLLRHLREGRDGVFGITSNEIALDTAVRELGINFVQFLDKERVNFGTSENAILVYIAFK